MKWNEIPAVYLAVASVAICIICICLTLFTDVAKVYLSETGKGYNAVNIAFSSDFNEYPYSAIDRYWRMIPLIFDAMLILVSVISFLYRKKSLVIIGCIVSLTAMCIGVCFNAIQTYEISYDPIKSILACGRMY